MTLSQEAKQRLICWRNTYLDTNHYSNRTSWDEYFLELTFNVAKRSNDSQTQCGAIIVSPSNEIVSTGYNGIIRDINNEILPNVRPEKYMWMVHAEHNAILSCARQGKSTMNCKMYITGHPCIMCCQYIWQVGIKEIIYGDNLSHMQNNKESDINIEIFKYLTGHSLKFRHINYQIKEEHV